MAVGMDLENGRNGRVPAEQEAVCVGPVFTCLLPVPKAQSPQEVPGAQLPPGKPGAQPPRIEKGKLTDAQAAGIIDAALRRLVRSEHAIGIVEGELLCALKQKGVNKLGYARITDYAAEELGHSRSYTNELLWLHTRLGKFSLINEAYREGLLTKCKVRLLLRNIEPPEEDMWIAMAPYCTVRALEEGFRNRKSALSAPAQDGAPPCVLDDEPAGVWMRVPVTPELTRKWSDGMELCRKVLGYQAPAHEFVEALAAEYLSGAPRVIPADAACKGGLETRLYERAGHPGVQAVGVTDSIETPPDTVDPSLRSLLAEICASGELPAFSKRESRRQREADLEDAFNEWDFLNWECIAMVIHEQWGEIPRTAHGIHRRLLDARQLRQSLQYSLAHLLHVMQHFGLLEELGFRDIGHYAVERLGMARSTAYAYAALGKQERNFPSVLEAMSCGLVSLFQAELILKVALDDESARKWIAWAETAPARILAEVVEQIELIKQSDYHRWRADEGRAPGESSLVVVEPNGRVRITEESREDDGLVQTCGRDEQAGDVAVCGRDEKAGAAEGVVQTCGLVEERTRGGHIRFWLPDDILAVWSEAVERCRAAHRGATGGEMTVTACLDLFLDSFFATWAADRKWEKEHEIIVRDGCRCQVPACTSRRNLNEHHLEFRSQGGSDEPVNRATICLGHHQRGVHEGCIRANGEAPDKITWVLGVARNEEPVAVFVSGVRQPRAWAAELEEIAGKAEQADSTDIGEV